MPLKSSTGEHSLDILNNVTTIPAFPLVWADENAELDEENAKMLKSDVILPMNLVDGFSYFMLAFGAILVIASWVMVLVCSSKHDNKYV